MVEIELMSCLVDTRSKMRRRASTETIRLVVVVERVADVIAERTSDWLSVVCNIRHNFHTLHKSRA